MTQKPKRPPSVWISQIILVIYSIVFTAAVAVLISALSNPNYESPIVIRVGALGMVIAALVLVVAAFIGLSKRRPWGRWLTVGILSLMVGLAILQFLSRMLGEGNPSAAYRTGQLFGSMLIIIPFAYLVFRLATGDPAHDFFNPPEDEAGEMFEPPPPPTFAE